uniref:Uncharacterized protein n=1 Tax=Anguilla anguilla TaxID=7936 RepID=A0A0E9VRN5_ANGAN
MNINLSERPGSMLLEAMQ